jgi:hypothetical protein
MKLRFDGLWRHPDFLRLWTSETISLFGSQITFLALPLTAVLALNATPFEMGLLGALEFLPFLLLSLFAGVWVDRRQYWAGPLSGCAAAGKLSWLLVDAGALCGSSWRRGADGVL